MLLWREAAAIAPLWRQYRSEMNNTIFHSALFFFVPSTSIVLISYACPPEKPTRAGFGNLACPPPASKHLEKISLVSRLSSSSHLFFLHSSLPHPHPLSLSLDAGRARSAGDPSVAGGREVQGGQRDVRRGGQGVRDG
jgi:hypothetical protein